MGPGRAVHLGFGSRPAVGEGGPSRLVHEIAVTELLADVDPGIVPPVVAADRGLGRIIAEHVEGSTLAVIGDDPVIWTATLSRLAEIQRVLAADLNALRVAGVAAAPLDRLAVSVPALLAADDLLRIGRPGGLSTPKPRCSGVKCRPSWMPVATSLRLASPTAWSMATLRPTRSSWPDGPGIPRLVGPVDHPSVPVRGLAPPIQ